MNPPFGYQALESGPRARMDRRSIDRKHKIFLIPADFSRVNKIFRKGYHPNASGKKEAWSLEFKSGWWAALESNQ
jgi:hypothetical protein